MLANWVGFACGFAPYGQVQWRLPLGIQILWGLILMAGLATFMPHSPRDLVRNGRVAEARKAFTKIRSDLHNRELHEEFGLMCAQIEYEKQREIKSYREIFRLYRRRVFVYVPPPRCCRRD